jgi:peptidyl-prolyl cis-trans isomerase C
MLLYSRAALAAILTLTLSAAFGQADKAAAPADKAAAPAEKAAAPAAKNPAAAEKAPALKAVTVNGKPIPKSRVDFFVKQQSARGVPDSEEMRRSILDQLVTQEVVAQAAEKKGLAKTQDFQTQLEMTRQRLLINAYAQDYFKTHPIKDEQLLAEYNKIKASRGEKEYKARHILVDTEPEAKDIIAQLNKGAKFADLAKASKDPGSKERGGDLDWAAPSTYVKPFADALTKLEKGKYTDTPVQTQFGWHVIQLDDVRPVSFPAFADVKPQLQNMIQEQEMQKVVRDLRAKAKID